MSAMLEVSALTAGYAGPAVLESVALDVHGGEIMGLLGANNAGKSTLINCISGVIAPRAGSVRFMGDDITRLRPEQIVARGIIQVPEGRQLFPRMSVLDNLLLGGTLPPARGQRASRLEQVYAIFPRLKERTKQFAGTMSGGEQQMLAIGRALMAGPKLLMLDEPSLGLSPLFVQTIFRALRDLNAQGLTMLLVEQNLNLTLSCAARGVVLERGRVAITGASATLANDPRTRQAYLGL